VDSDFVGIIERSRQGDEAARATIAELIRSDLRRLARLQLRGKRWMTLNTTALVNESFLRLASPAASHVETRLHFLNLAARIMRHVVCDYARRRLSAPFRHDTDGSLADAADEQVAQARQFVSLDEALHNLAQIHPRQAQIVECRFFVGLSDEETALAMKISTRTVQREWNQARQWLAENMRDD
jgi:RNA polymerase sigma factor (TIGR02999 family)